MKNTFFGIVVLVTLLILYGSIPLKTVSIISLTLTDQNGTPIEQNANVNFIDANKQYIHTVSLESRGSFNNTLHWWAHSHYSEDTSPRDAQRTQHAIINADGCEAITVPILLKRQYEALSFAPHGGGAAYFILEHKQNVTLTCTSQP